MKAQWSVILFVPLSLLSFLYSSCNKDEPCTTCPPYMRSIELSVEDTSCTEAWLRVKLVGVAPPQTVQLKRLNPTPQTLQTVQLNTSDSLLLDTALAPHNTYTYKAYRLQDSRVIDSTTALTITTMDTTSHDWTFQIDTLGDGAGSVLNDVAIINDTLAYAVGEIYKRDSLGNWDPLPYNLVKWTGQQWELKRVTVMFRGNPVTVPLEGIFAHSAIDIWVMGSIPIHGNGVSWVGYDIQTVSKAWGTPDNMYFVGRAGTIIRYTAGTWQRLESGMTELDVYDIFGKENRNAAQTEILAVASKVFVNYERKILGINGITVTTLSDSGINWPLSSVWFIPQRHYYVVGSGIYEKRNITEPRWRNGPLDITTYYTNAVRGTALNNVFVVGAYGEFLHYNGVRWQSFRSRTGLVYGQYHGVAAKDDLVLAVGQEYPRGAILRGKRTP